MHGKNSPEKRVTEVRLIEAAAQLFARQGFKATTTREIAQLADLNEATLFRYFPRKPDLFLAALEFHLCRIKLSRDLQLSMAADEDPKLVLPKAVTFLLHILETQPELQQLLQVAGFELPEAGKLIRDHLGPIYDAVCAYFKRSVDKGVIRSIEPDLAAFGLLGVVTAHQQCLEIFARERPYSDPEKAIAAYAALCLYGIQPLVPSVESFE